MASTRSLCEEQLLPIIGKTNSWSYHPITTSTRTLIRGPTHMLAHTHTHTHTHPHTHKLKQAQQRDKDAGHRQKHKQIDKHTFAHTNIQKSPKRKLNGDAIDYLADLNRAVYFWESDIGSLSCQ